MNVSIYLDPDRYDLLAQLTGPADLSLYLSLIERWGGPVLELGCGSGRLTLPMANAGVDVAGVDLSEPMIASARRKASRKGLACELRVGDLRDLDLGITFALVLLPYNTFNHLLDLTDQRRCLQTVAQHSTSESRFVLDIFNPDPAKLSVGGSAPKKLVEYLEPTTGQRLTLFEEARYEPATQVNHVTRRTVASDGEVVAIDELDFRVVFPCELDTLLELLGFEVEEKLGDYDGKPFESLSSKQVVICRYRGL